MIYHFVVRIGVLFIFLSFLIRFRIWQIHPCIGEFLFYPPNELKELFGGVDKDNVKLTLGPNIKKKLLEDLGAAEEYLEMVKKLDIPNVAKHSFITEVNEIIEQVKKNLIKTQI